MLKQVNVILFTLFTSLFYLNSQTIAQVKENPGDITTPVTIDNSEQFSIFSSNTQQEYKIFVHLPFSYARTDTIYPVVYGLDADIGFGMLSEMSTLLAFRNEMPEVIIVGIAYGSYPGQEGNNRRRDFTPTPVESVASSGGAENFFRFIRDELIPLIDLKYRTNPADKSLLGFSLSGLFSLYALFNHPDLFNRYLIASPSIWWDTGVTFNYEEQYSKEHTDLAARIFISVGDAEGTVESWKKLVEILESRNYKELKLSKMIFDNAPHSTATILAGVRGIKALFQNE